MTTQAEQITRRSAVALAAALLATVATAIVTVGGLHHWGAPASHPPLVAQVQQQAPPAQEELD